ncbi:BQ2448_7177 [Microbotryum intermedium]|uniref:BQ2448_7177 protein n=1 Tax=Microbotryum intermedium TaxID=269621 RepID=A0A238FHG8_9BASI|nr:BQ2448_7177 [Microbotryum intermedium]
MLTGQGMNNSHVQPQPPQQQVFIIVRPPPSKGVDLKNLQIQLVNTTRPTHPAHTSSGKLASTNPTRIQTTPPPHLGQEVERNLGPDLVESSDQVGSLGTRRPWTTSGSTSTWTLGAKSFDAVAAATIDSYDHFANSGPNEPSSPHHLSMPTTDQQPSHPGSTEMIRSTSWQSDKSSSSAISTRSSMASSIGSTGTTYSIGFGSVATGSSSGEKRRGKGSIRRVTPLYNLGSHALLQTVVTDAGTDEKIAKFSKKGTIEMMDFAMLEPFDLSAPPTISSPATTTTTTSSSALALIWSRGEEGTNDVQSPTGGLLSKLTKRMGLGKSAIRGNGGAGVGRSSRSLTTPISHASGGGSITKESNRSPTELRANVSPDPANTVVAPLGKLPRGYAFSANKFLRKDLVEAQRSTGMVVKFEWKRMEKRRVGARNRSRSKSLSWAEEAIAVGGRRKEGSQRTLTETMMMEGKSGAEASSPDIEEGRSRLKIPFDGRGSKRRSGDTTSMSDVSFGSSRVSGESERGVSLRGFKENEVSRNLLEEEEVEPEPEGQKDEEEEDSDLEDSDRPWSCTLYITHLNIKPHTQTSPPKRLSEAWSLPLATLIPAPHHPRLVANLSFSPSISYVRLGDLARISEEDLKDVVSVTALWIIAKEGLGGKVGGSKVATTGKGGRKGSFGAG